MTRSSSLSPPRSLFASSLPLSDTSWVDTEKYNSSHRFGSFEFISCYHSHLILGNVTDYLCNLAEKKSLNCHESWKLQRWSRLLWPPTYYVNTKETRLTALGSVFHVPLLGIYYVLWIHYATAWLGESTHIFPTIVFSPSWLQECTDGYRWDPQTGHCKGKLQVNRINSTMLIEQVCVFWFVVWCCGMVLKKTWNKQYIQTNLKRFSIFSRYIRECECGNCWVFDLIYFRRM